MDGLLQLSPPGRAAGWSPTFPLPQIGAPHLGTGCAGMEKIVDGNLVQENYKMPVSPMGPYHSSMPQAGLAPAGRNGKNYLISKTVKEKKSFQEAPGGTKNIQAVTEKPPLTENNDPKCLWFPHQLRLKSPG